ncbi:hypothetical protein LZ31DRAFT_218400 [Colletotrichum somersetense]|nr:hypothetical protein LZ31DRAFT_218400 [Colletotrichum somersetense]
MFPWQLTLTQNREREHHRHHRHHLHHQQQLSGKPKKERKKFLARHGQDDSICSCRACHDPSAMLIASRRKEVSHPTTHADRCAVCQVNVRTNTRTMSVPTRLAPTCMYRLLLGPLSRRRLHLLHLNTIRT